VSERARGAALALALAAGWVFLGRELPQVLWHAMPRALLDSLTLPTYGVICQVKPAPLGAAVTELVAPLVFVVASYLALKIAEPYLLEELATQGAGASRRNAGAFGKAVTEAPLVVTLLWGALLAAISEELVFRGAVWGAVAEVTEVIGARLAGSRWVATLVSAAVFGAMHADMRGSVGIVRVVATTLLGLACGGARWASGSVVAAMLLHFTYNTISIGVGRGWFAGGGEPVLAVVPNPLLILAVCGALLAAALVAMGARKASVLTRAE
jgi:membrane protease YdiL (CAAX protease family)